MAEPLELLVERPPVEQHGARARLLAPEVGLFQAGFRRGALVSAGSTVGVLVQLGVARALLVPAGVEGRVASERPVRAHEPVGWGDALLEIELTVERGDAAGATTGGATTAGTTAAQGAAACVRAPTSGRFWHRPAPGEPPYVREGARIEDGAPVGLLEVMKTFSPVVYRAGSVLPAPGPGLPATGSGLPAAGSGLPAAGSGLPAAGSGLPAAGSGLPARARVVRMLAADGADVRAGEPLVELEPAP